MLFDKDWRFRLADPKPSSVQPGWSNDGRCRDQEARSDLDDSGWPRIALPHDFVVERPPVLDAAFPELGEEFSSKMRGYRAGAVAWYRKRFHLPREDGGRRIYLRFDGVYRDSNVYLNDFFVGHHLSGYTSFAFDVTDFVNYDEDNLVAVRVDATRNEGWWYEGGGIYRHVWLEKVAPVHVANWGTFVSSEVDLDGSQPRARLTLETRVANKTSDAGECEIHSVVVDPSGQDVGEATDSLALPIWGEAELEQSLQIDEARLWSLETPQLYRLVTTVYSKGAPVDRYETTFGIRRIRFDAEKGFLLNEQSVKLKGVCCHHDHAGVGIAVPDALHKFRLEKLKEMGCNAYRSSHHPASPALLDLCDHLGILVMDENRILSSSAESLAQLESMVRRDRNHPSVILWSLGNEEVSVQWRPQSRAITRALKSLLLRLDPTRPVTLAVCYWNPKIAGDEPLSNTPLPCPELNVMGFNYAPQHWEAYHELHPEQPLVVSEAGSGLRTRGTYVTDLPRRHTIWDYRGDEQCPETQWAKVARYPYLSGIFIWTGFDYRGEPTPYDWPAHTSQFGVMDTCGFPKDNYFYYRAWWRGDPLVHLAPHWNWPDRVGEPIRVYCCTNCDEVELFVNGVSHGRKSVERNRHLEWPEVVYEPGAIEAKGYKEGAIVAEDRVETTGTPHGVRLASDRDAISADGRDVAVVTVAITDQEGRVVPVADNRVVFSVQGEGRILGVGNGDPAGLEPEQGTTCRAFHGLCQVIVQSADQPGMIVLTGSSLGLHVGECVIQVRGEDGGARSPVPDCLAPQEKAMKA